MKKRPYILLLLLLLFFCMNVYASEVTDLEVKITKSIKEGDISGAIRQSEKLLVSTPDDLKLLWNLEKWYGWKSMAKQRISVLEKIYVLEPDNLKVLNALGSEKLWAGDAVESIQYFEKSLKIDGKQKEIKKRLISAYLAAKNNQKSLKLIDNYLLENESDIDMLFVKAQACHWDVCWGESLTAYNKILSRDPQHELAYKYNELLKEKNKHNILLNYKMYADSTKVYTNTFSVMYEKYLASRHSVLINYSNLALKDKGNELATNELYAKYLFSLTKFTNLGFKLGWNINDEEPVAGLEYNSSFLVSNYYKLIYLSNKYYASYSSLVADIRYDKFQGSIYSEYFDKIIMSGILSNTSFSDSNNLLILSLDSKIKFLKNYSKVYLRFGYIKQIFDQIYSDSFPYYTENANPTFLLGIGINELDYVNWKISGGMNISYRDSENISYQPSINLSYSKGNDYKINISFSRSGSASFVYNQTQVGLIARF